MDHKGNQFTMVDWVIPIQLLVRPKQVQFVGFSQDQGFVFGCLGVVDVSAQLPVYTFQRCYKTVPYPFSYKFHNDFLASFRVH